MKLATYLEQKSTNLHITHLEEILLSEPVDKVISILNKIVDKEVTPTIKFDGSVAIIFGINPETKQFVIGNKRIFTKPAHSVEDIQKVYSDNVNLQKIMIAFFNEFSPIIKDNLYSGDLMWEPGQLKTSGDFLEFKPNTIKYQIPTQSKLAQQIKNKKYGFVIHTQLNGSTLKSLSTNNNIDINKFKAAKNIWVGDANLSSYNNDQQQRDIKELKSEINELKKLDSSLVDLSLPLTKLSSAFVKINQDNLTLEKQYDKLYKILYDSYKSVKEQERIKDLFTDNKEKIIRFLQLNNKIIKIKHDIINLLNESNLLQTSAIVNGEYETNSGEGFVAMYDNKFIKLVNRTEFSKINSEASKNRIAQEVADKINL